MELRLSTGYDPDADIRGENRGQFKSDLLFGEIGENHAKEFLDSILNGWAEVKSDAFDNGNIFLEVAHCPGRRKDASGNFIWQKSGINTTQAQYFIYIKQSQAGRFRGALVLETERLLRFHRAFKKQNGIEIHESGLVGTGYMYGNMRGEIPTVGLRICPDDVSKILYSSHYD